MLGVSLGVLGTIGVTWLDGARGRRAASDTANREDHIRDIDRRREVYRLCLTATRESFEAVIAAPFRLAWPSLRRSADARERDQLLLAAAAALMPLRGALDLLAQHLSGKRSRSS